MLFNNESSEAHLQAGEGRGGRTDDSGVLLSLQRGAVLFSRSSFAKPEKRTAPLGARKGVCVWRQESRDGCSSQTPVMPDQNLRCQNTRSCQLCKRRCSLREHAQCFLPQPQGPGESTGLALWQLLVAGGSWWCSWWQLVVAVSSWWQLVVEAGGSWWQVVAA